jgi:hypothetical protein
VKLTTMRTCAVVVLAGVLAFAAAARGQVNARSAQIGYAYPAGGRQGASFEVIVGGQSLRGVNEAFVTGKGVHVSVVQYYNNIRNLNPDQRLALITDLDDARNKRVAELGLKGPVPLFPGEALTAQRLAAAKQAAKAKADAEAAKAADAAAKPADAAKPAEPAAKPANPAQLARAQGEVPPSPYLRDVARMDLRQLMVVADMYLNYRVISRREDNPQLADTVLLKVTIDADAPLGDRELRLATPSGLTTPICFQVSNLPEVLDQEPDEPARTFMLPPLPPVELPVMFNGQILPGDVDTLSFSARKGQHLVIETFARRLIPFLADAVPGWFQPAVTLYDPQGKEVAFADHYEFHPDPVILYNVPQDGAYRLEVRDTIYRGREDFVYRIAIGELPFITSAFPLGGRAGSQVTAAVQGCNLPAETLPLDTSAGGPQVRSAVLHAGGGVSNAVTYAVDDLPECAESEPNDDAAGAQAVTLPVIVNGRIGKDGDVDVFRFEGRAGDQVVADVEARRLGSPLDSLLRIIDSDGKVLACNDDYMPTDGDLRPDMGTVTHQADSYLMLKLPADGAYYVQVSDAQGHGADACAYRLRISAPRPDFRVLMDPSSLLLTAGSPTTVAVHVLRQDGFAGDVEVALKDAPEGFGLAGGRVPAGKESADVRILVPGRAAAGPVELDLQATAQIDGQAVTRPVAPADDEMQAFLWRHLVPSQDLLAVVRPARGPLGRGAAARGRTGRGPLDAMPRLPAGLQPPPTVKVPAGGAALVRVDVPGAMRVAGLLHLELRDPPAGVSIADVRVVPGGLTFQLKVEGDAAMVGMKGALTVGAYAQRPNGPRRVDLGTLPPVSFEVVSP